MPKPADFLAGISNRQLTTELAPITEASAEYQAISYALQYGVPLQTLVDKFSHSRFEPSGMTKNPEVRFAKSIIDYIFRWMATKFLSPEAQYRAGVNLREKPEDDDRRTLQPTAPPRSAG